MVETLITSSALIVGVCAFRRLFKGRISPSVQYAMWGIPALRLLLPLFYPADQWLRKLKSSFSVMNAVDSLHAQVIEGTEIEPLVDNIMTGRVRGYSNPQTLPQKLVGVDWQLVILAVWLTGSAVLLVWILWVNFRFAARLRRDRVRCRGAVYNASGLPVYRAPGLRTPCLVMLFGEQSIYLPEDLEASPEQIRHILVHETCHARHRDPVWGALRCMLVCAYWINPFVYLAAFLSRRDCELACDQAAVKVLGEESRFDYGRTLIALTAGKRADSGMFCIAADFVFGQKTMKERITLLAARPRTTALTAALVLAAAAALIACTYTGKAPEGVQKRTGLWAQNFCRRDGRALADMYSPGRRDDFYEMEPVSTEENGSYLGFGWSSPWPMDEQYHIGIDGTGAEITYYAMTSDPHLWVWKETLEWVETDGIYYVDRESLAIFDEISTAAEFEAAYRQGIGGTPMDYRTNDKGSALNEYAKRDPVMRLLLAPDTAGPYLLNLAGGQAHAEIDDDQAMVAYRFGDGSQVEIAMERPFGADGIWVPVGWSEGAQENGEQALTIYEDGDLQLQALGYDGESQMYEGITVRRGEVSETFPDWRQTGKWPEDYPAVSRLDGGYILVSLVTGEGTGVLEAEAHVLAESDLREIGLQDPRRYAADHITSSLENGRVLIYLDGHLAGVFKLEGDETRTAFFDQVYCGAVTEYGQRGGMPGALLSITASPSLTVGTLDLTYAQENGAFRVAEAAVETPESAAVRAVVRQFAEAYFRDDPKGMAAVMAGTAAKKVSGAGEAVWERLDVFAIKGDLSDAADRDQLEVQCEYRVAGDDSYTYLGVELAREETGWGVTGYYLEK